VFTKRPTTHETSRDTKRNGNTNNENYLLDIYSFIFLPPKQPISQKTDGTYHMYNTCHIMYGTHNRKTKTQTTTTTYHDQHQHQHHMTQQQHQYHIICRHNATQHNTHTKGKMSTHRSHIPKQKIYSLFVVD